VIELDGFETVHPPLGPVVVEDDPAGDCARAVRNAIDHGGQPTRVLVDVAYYRALLARNGLSPRTFNGRGSALFVTVDGATYPVDADRHVPAGGAVCLSLAVERGRA